MGSDSKGTTQARVGKAPAAPSRSGSRDASRVDDAARTSAPAEPAPVAPAAPKQIALVDGRQVAELYVNLKGDPHLITWDSGTHIFTRVYYFNGIFHCGDRTNNVIGCEYVTMANYQPEVGLTLYTTRYKVFVPTTYCTANWSNTYID